MASCTVLLVFCSAIGTAVGLVFMPIQFLISAWPLGWMWGYLYCQWLLDHGRRPFVLFRHDSGHEGQQKESPSGLEEGKVAGHIYGYGWKATFTGSLFLLACGIISIMQKLSLVIAIPLVGTPWLAFLAGYGYRRDLVNQGRCPKWRFLRLTGDCVD